MTDEYGQMSEMSDENKKRPTLWEKANEARLAKQKELNRIKVELQVRDSAHAKSPEVIEFCILHLSKDGTWDELRRKLGLGTASRDVRWREVRAAVLEGLVPGTEEEAMQAQADMRQYLMVKVKNFVEDTEAFIQTAPDGKDGMALLSNFMKLRLDGIQTMLAQNEKSFNAFINVRKAKSMDRRTGGKSVVIQNNFHINRPGDAPREVSEVTKTVSTLIGTAAKAGEAFLNDGKNGTGSSRK